MCSCVYRDYGEPIVDGGVQRGSDCWVDWRGQHIIQEWPVWGGKSQSAKATVALENAYNAIAPVAASEGENCVGARDTTGVIKLDTAMPLESDSYLNPCLWIFLSS